MAPARRGLIPSLRTATRGVHHTRRLEALATCLRLALRRRPSRLHGYAARSAAGEAAAADVADARDHARSAFVGAGATRGSGVLDARAARPDAHRDCCEGHSARSGEAAA